MPKKKFAVDLFQHREAEFSECRQYRYSLLIVWNADLPVCAFIGVNPSTADECVDDPTVRRCRGFAESFGCGGLMMLNLFGYRATDPRVMKAHPSPVGGGNTLTHIKNKLTMCKGPWIAAWGGDGLHRGRGAFVAESIPQLQCLRVNTDGTPGHPLYLKGDLKPMPYKVHYPSTQVINRHEKKDLDAIGNLLQDV